MNRRIFLKRVLATAAIAGFTPPLLSARKAFGAVKAEGPDSADSPNAPVNLSPITRIHSGRGSGDFNGDEMDHPHDVLWNKDEFLRRHGGIPAPTESTSVVIVGGGMAGLMAAYRLRELQPILLEQASRLGGNSKAEAWTDSSSNSAYSLGAAYITTPEEGSPIEGFLTELGLRGHLREETADGTTVLKNGAIMSGFWGGKTDPANAGEFVRVRQALAKIKKEAYPNIPFDSTGSLSLDQMLKLDSTTFTTWIKENLGPIHPHVDEYLHHYCWSSFAADCDELSAAQVLNFLTGDLNGVIALPGGNATIAHEIYARLHPLTPRGGALVIDVALNNDGVRVCYEQGGKLKSIQARACIVAAPKFVAKGLLPDISQEQAQAMNHIKHRAYVVANVMLNTRVASPSYDLFRVTGKVPTYPKHDIEERGFTDLTFASWAAGDRAAHSVLTLYRALPYDGARQFLFNPNAHDKHRTKIENDLPELLHGLGLSGSAIEGIRMTRWGHALPTAQVGMLAGGAPREACKPIGGRIFFAGQDNWVSPCFETAVETAVLAAAEAKKVL